MSTLLKEITLSDVVCELDDGKEFQLYKSILAARSPVFKAMFTSELEEAHYQTNVKCLAFQWRHSKICSPISTLVK